MAPQKAPMPPSSAATVAMTQPRSLDQRGDRRIRDGQRPQREEGQRAGEVELSRVAGSDGQDLERGGGGLYHLVGAFGVERPGTHIECGGDGQEKG